jgi:prepilin-type N-terminal cleavage/methylation domain-containing protein/prepilin-type processing-associated H-X9-DG protein
VRKRGFTLIELLVVIAMVAILAATLFPVYTKARARGTLSPCQSNLRAIAQAFLMYAQDNDGKFMASRTKCSIPPNVSRWGPANYEYYIVVSPYLKNWKTWACPSASGVNDCPADANGSVHYAAVNLAVEHGLVPANLRVNYAPTEYLKANSARLASFRHPARTYLIGDAASFPRAEEVAYANTCHAMPAGCGQGKAGWKEENTRHNGGSNIAFVDGHVKWMSAGDILASKRIEWAP